MPNSLAAATVQRRAVGIALAAVGAKNLAAGAKAGIKEPKSVEFAKRVGIIAAVFALTADRAVEGDAKPGEIVLDSLLELSLAARQIDILNAQQQLRVARQGCALIDERGIGVAEV